jgi:predicted acyl esterase
MVHEAHDAPDTMQWLRKQDWFDGRLGSIGASYLGFTQYGLMMGAADELKASVVMMGPHDFGKAAVGNGAPGPANLLGMERCRRQHRVARRDDGASGDESTASWPGHQRTAHDRYCRQRPSRHRAVVS